MNDGAPLGWGTAVYFLSRTGFHVRRGSPLETTLSEMNVGGRPRKWMLIHADGSRQDGQECNWQTGWEGHGSAQVRRPILLPSAGTLHVAGQRSCRLQCAQSPGACAPHELLTPSCMSLWSHMMRLAGLVPGECCGVRAWLCSCWRCSCWVTGTCCLVESPAFAELAG